MNSVLLRKTARNRLPHLISEPHGAEPAMEIMTVVEGKVDKSSVQKFEDAYSSVKDQPKPPGWKRSMLLRETTEEGLYRVATLWQSREALDEMRKSTSVPVALALFRSVGVEPNLRIFEIPLTIER
jgi:heme-degrading monooxygenase HmoA